jgi:hypothetical protein
MRQVSATELAKLGKCERQAYFDYCYGEDTTLTAKYIHKGNEAHEQFNQRLSGRTKQGLFVKLFLFIWRLVVRIFWR